MTHRHAFRRGVAPRPSSKDLRVWSRLLSRADRVLKRPDDVGLPFVIAAEKACKAIAPVGHQHTGSAFVDLVRLGSGWLTIPADKRAASLDQLKTLTAACREALEASEGRQRKDIDG